MEIRGSGSLSWFNPPAGVAGKRQVLQGEELYDPQGAGYGPLSEKDLKVLHEAVGYSFHWPPKGNETMPIAAWHLSQIRSDQLAGKASPDTFAEIYKVNERALRMSGKKIFDDVFLRAAARAYGEESFSANLFLKNGGSAGLYA